MTSYPSYVDGKPPVLSLREYDFAPWNKTTCVDKEGSQYKVVDMNEPNQVVALIDEKDNTVMDIIFRSAIETHVKQSSGKNAK